MGIEIEPFLGRYTWTCGNYARFAVAGRLEPGVRFSFRAETRSVGKQETAPSA